MNYDGKQITPTLRALSLYSRRRDNGADINHWNLWCEECGDVSQVAESLLPTLTTCPSPKHGANA